MPILEPTLLASHWLQLFSAEPHAEHYPEPLPRPAIAAKPSRSRAHWRDAFGRSSQEFFAGRHSYLGGMERVECPFARGSKRDRWLLGWAEAQTEFQRSFAPAVEEPVPYAAPATGAGFSRALGPMREPNTPISTAPAWSNDH